MHQIRVSALHQSVGIVAHGPREGAHVAVGVMQYAGEVGKAEGIADSVRATLIPHGGLGSGEKWGFKVESPAGWVATEQRFGLGSGRDPPCNATSCRCTEMGAPELVAYMTTVSKDPVRKKT